MKERPRAVRSGSRGAKWLLIVVCFQTKEEPNKQRIPPLSLSCSVHFHAPNELPGSLIGGRHGVRFPLFVCSFVFPPGARKFEGESVHVQCGYLPFV